MAQIPLGPDALAVPGPPLEGYSTSSQAAVEGFSVGGTVTRQARGPGGLPVGPVTTQILEGSGAYGSLAGTDRIFSEHAGVYGESDQRGVFGSTTHVGGIGVYGIVRTAGFAMRAEARGGGTAVSGSSLDNSGPAASFEGTVQITGAMNQTGGDVTVDGGNLTLTAGSLNVAKGDITLAGADCAEEFQGAPGCDLLPGIVVIIGKDGFLEPGSFAYDKAVAGVISGAGMLQPGLLLGKQSPSRDRVPLALIGRVNCYVDADYMSVEIGDLLTTSPTSGHAMKADDPARAFGAILGKALAPLSCGRKLLPILVALQ